MNGLAKNHKNGLFRFGALCRVQPYFPTNFPMSAILGVGHVEFCTKMLYFMNALTYRYETRYASSAPCPDGTQKVLGQKLVVKSYNEISKNANNFCLH